ncbi:MAG: ribonuclease PH [Candidatus Babeliales bacterium]
MQRSHNRAYNELRPLNLTCGISSHADGSVLFEIGNTKVLCTVSLTGQVPIFLRGRKKWWLTASYSLLPASTKNRIERESLSKRNERSIEISRLIGRSLRSVVDLSNKLSEKTVHIDCDVIQADGGTRTACITGSFIALKLAEQKWLQKGLLESPIITEEIAAISVGLLKNEILLDIDFAEDSNVKADFNFVLTRSGNVVEIQGSAEQEPVSWQQIVEMQEVADNGVKKLLAFIDQMIDCPKKSPKILHLENI